MVNASVLLLTLLIASILAILFVSFLSKKTKKSNGNVVLICGGSGSGKTSLFLKILGKFKGFNEILHSVEENSALLPDGKILLVDQATRHRLLHSSPLDYFHYDALTGIIFVSDDIEILAAAVAVAIAKEIPLGLFRCPHSPLPALIKHLHALQKTPPTGEVFNQPVNRLLFETVEGDLADWEPVVKRFFGKQVKMLRSEDEVKTWILEKCQ